MPGGGSKPGYQRGPGRAGIPNKDKADLRALVQERVHEFTLTRRDQIERELRAKNPDMPLAQIMEQVDIQQPLEEEWDPVVALSIMAVDPRNKTDLRRQASSDAAQYVRPKLKTIEHLEDPESLELMRDKQELALRLTDLLAAAVGGKSSAKPAAPPPAADVNPEDWR
jgi:hypothetical protein